MHTPHTAYWRHGEFIAFENSSWHEITSTGLTHSCYQVCQSFYPKGLLYHKGKFTVCQCVQTTFHAHTLPPPPAPKYSWAEHCFLYSKPTPQQVSLPLVTHTLPKEILQHYTMLQSKALSLPSHTSSFLQHPQTQNRKKPHATWGVENFF